MPAGVLEGLRRRGHDVRPAASWIEGWGPVSLIDLDPHLVGATDPRVSTTAAIAGAPDEP
jgi:gamma-glutamyltranspeptidase/glutathione hydrolase